MQILFRFEKELRSLDPKYDLTVDGTTLQSFLCNFVWKNARFSLTAHTAQSLVARIKDELIQTDMEIKDLSGKYNVARQTHEGLTRKSSGTLQSRSIADLVSKEDMIQQASEYLVAVFLVVNREMRRDLSRRTTHSPILSSLTA